MDLFVRLIEILVWPVVVVLLFLRLRKHIEGLFRGLQRFKFKDFENDIKTLEQIREDIEIESNIRVAPTTDRSGLHPVVGTSPALAVMEAWNDLEGSAKNKVEEILPNDETFRDPLRRPFDYLNYKGVLSPTIASAVRDLREMRNRAARAENEAVSEDYASQFLGVVDIIKGQIDTIAAMSNIKLAALTSLIMELNRLIDSREFDGVTIDEVCDWIRNKEIVRSLAARAESKADLRPYMDNGTYTGFMAFYHDQMSFLLLRHTGDHKRKWGVENRGLCLLLAWTNQLVQQGSGWRPNEISSGMEADVPTGRGTSPV